MLTLPGTLSVACGRDQSGTLVEQFNKKSQLCGDVSLEIVIRLSIIFLKDLLQEDCQEV